MKKSRLSILILVAIVASCSTARDRSFRDSLPEQKIFSVNQQGRGDAITVDLRQGRSFYYPLMAIWVEDMEGNYLQTLFVPNSVATGIFEYGIREVTGWVRAPRRAPQSVPYWAHKRGVRASDGLFMPEPSNPVADAYSGATPQSGFVMTARTDEKIDPPYRVMLEINQNWAWNNYWTNDKFPDDVYYLNSGQPAVVYEAVITEVPSGGTIVMRPIGHSHPSGSTGELFDDLSTLTTALEIADSVFVSAR